MRLNSLRSVTQNWYSLLIIVMFALSINTILNSERLYKRDQQ